MVRESRYLEQNIGQGSEVLTKQNFWSSSKKKILKFAQRLLLHSYIIITTYELTNKVVH